MDDCLLLDGDAGSFDRHDALIVIPSRLLCSDDGFQGVAEVLEDKLLVFQGHCQDSIQPGGDLCGDPRVLLEDVSKAAPPAGKHCVRAPFQV